MAKQTKPRLLRLIFQARFKPELSYFTQADRVASGFQTEYPIWQRDSDGEIRLIDYEHRCLLDIAHNSLAYSQDSADRELAISRITQALERVPPGLQIKSYLRIGLRQLLIIPIKMGFDSLVAIMNAKLLAQDPSLKQLFPERIDDLLYRINGSEGERIFHITVAPVRRDEIEQKIVKLHTQLVIEPAKMQDAIRTAVETYPETAVYLDLDVFVVGDRIDTSTAHGFLTSAGERIEQMADRLGDYLFQTTVQQK